MPYLGIYYLLSAPRKAPSIKLKILLFFQLIVSLLRDGLQNNRIHSVSYLPIRVLAPVNTSPTFVVLSYTIPKPFRSLRICFDNPVFIQFKHRKMPIFFQLRILVQLCSRQHKRRGRPQVQSLVEPFFNIIKRHLTIILVR